jgi:hypothetical protein
LKEFRLGAPSKPNLPLPALKKTNYQPGSGRILETAQLFEIYQMQKGQNRFVKEKK